MLILTRGPQQKVFIRLPDGRQVVVEVVEAVSKNKIRLGFQAPDDVVILREELVQVLADSAGQ